ncbi:MAG: hypothetical protein D6808_02635 [Candidatus Dadabacteria bacterium]|nr:MAG: hypothetical protein D6808_02635 [Candidatus Dadabacteria bacterium]
MNKDSFFAILAVLTLQYLFIAFRRHSFSQGLSYNFLLLYAVALRVWFVLTPPFLSSDIWRYIWEGKVFLNGFSPYMFPPDSPRLAALRDSNWFLIDHRHLTAIYPPFALYLFSLFAQNIYLWKAFMGFCDLCSLALISKILTHFNRPRENLLLYAFLPLSLIEISLEGHIEGALVPVFLLFFYLVAAMEGSLIISAIAAFGVGLKYIIVVPYIYYLKDLTLKEGLKHAIHHLSAFLFICLLLFFPFLSNPSELFGSFSVYVTHWKFNDSLFHLIGTVLGVDWNRSETFQGIKIAFGLLWLLLLVFMALRRVSIWSFSFFALAFLLSLSPVVHPWYVLWLIPPLTIFPNTAGYWLALSSPLAYWPVLYSSTFSVPLWIRIVEYLPFLCLLAISFVKLSREELRFPNSQRHTNGELGFL